MQIDSSRGTFEDVLKRGSPVMIPIAKALWQFIADLYPQVTEILRPAEVHADYGVEILRMSEVFGYICPMEYYVRLGFYHGSALEGPHEMLLGAGKRLRHIKFYSVEDTRHPAVRDLLHQAVQERTKANGYLPE